MSKYKNYRVLIEHGGKEYEWRGEAQHESQAKAIAVSQLCRLYELDKKRVYVGMTLVERCTSLHPKHDNDVRVLLYRKLGKPLPARDIVKEYNQLAIEWGDDS